MESHNLEKNSTTAILTHWDETRTPGMSVKGGRGTIRNSFEEMKDEALDRIGRG